jgi:hypothetical protein
MCFKLNLAAQVSGHFFAGCNEVVADTRAGPAPIGYGRSFAPLVFRYRHSAQTEPRR